MGKKMTVKREEDVPIIIEPFKDCGKCDCCPNGVHSYFHVDFWGIQSYRKFFGVGDADGLIEDFLKQHANEGINGRKLRITLEIVVE